MDWATVAGELLLAFVPLFVVVDPLASIGLFLGLTDRMDRRGRDRVALRACAFAVLVLLAFAFAGQAILRYLGIELYSLRTAGGILLALIGLNMLKEGEEVPHSELVVTGGAHPTDREPAHDPSLVPLGLPMLAGPGAISLVILLGSQLQEPGRPLEPWASALVLGSAILLVMVASWAVLKATSRASHILGRNTRRVITRIMGLLTVAFAMQYVFDGVRGFMSG